MMDRCKTKPAPSKNPTTPDTRSCIINLMSDTYIDKYEPLTYGRFALGQIKRLVLGLDADFDPVVNTISLRLKHETDAMQAVLEKAGDIAVVTYKSAQGQPSAVSHAQDGLRRLIHYVESYPNGDAMAEDLLQGVSLTTTLRRRPVKLAASLTHALNQLAKYEQALPEYSTRVVELTALRDALDTLNADVRKSRTDRLEMTPEVSAQRSKWLVTYGATKLIVEGILKLHGKEHLMPEIFDDLAEVQKASGVSDAAPAQPKPA